MSYSQNDLELIDLIIKSEYLFEYYRFFKSYKILIIDRGERLFFQEDDKCLICNISARFSILEQESLSYWSDGTIISNKQILIKKIKKYYSKAYSNKLKVV